ncbi:hypothetical protein [Clostridium sp. YIM B02551]|uniref:hypothetical protein n=1 Tax=Clostridium sp. YIM B02551 TaxID=2910679 RepID=UPI001EEC4437|nr:hypothetical protein [Clostridium sp. YIM B02551]
MDNLTLGLICTLIGAAGVLITQKRNFKQDTKEETSNSTRVEIKLDYAINGIDEIKSDIKDTKKDVNTLADRLTRVEESTKSAHKRLDEFEK